jgi:hypothetical protein
MRAKGMNTADSVLAKDLTNRLIHSLRMQEHRGRVKRDGERKGRHDLAIALRLSLTPHSYP